MIEEAQRIIEHIEAINGNVKWSYIYAGINAAAQITLGAITIGINAAASRKKDDDIWDAVSVMNMFV